MKKTTMIVVLIVLAALALIWTLVAPMPKPEAQKESYYTTGIHYHWDTDKGVYVPN